MDKRKVRIENRKKLILEILEKQPGGVPLEQLAKEVGVSTITLNLDLDDLILKNKVIVRLIGSAKIHYHSKYSDYVFKNESSNVVMNREGNWRRYQASDSLQKRPKNTVFFSNSNSIEHEIVKSTVCIKLQRAGLEFVTEVINKETGEKADIIVLDNGKRIEIETGEKRAKRFDGTDVIVLRIDYFKYSPHMKIFHDLHIDEIIKGIKT